MEMHYSVHIVIMCSLFTILHGQHYNAHIARQWSIKRILPYLSQLSPLRIAQKVPVFQLVIYRYPMIYKIDYCIRGKPEDTSYLFTWAGDDEDAAYYALDWVVAHDYSLLDVTQIHLK